MLPRLNQPSLLSTFRSASTTTFKNPSNKRFFTPSASNMVIKTYFNVSWTGPEVKVDNQGNVTSTGEVKGKLCHCYPSIAGSVIILPPKLEISSPKRLSVVSFYLHCNC
jgi:hypothetical protein